MRKLIHFCMASLRLVILSAILLQSSFGDGASAQGTVTLTRGPYLGNQTVTSVQIIWNTNIAADSRVEYGLDTTYGYSVTSAVLSTTHVLTLTNLPPGKLYGYRILSNRAPLASSTLTTNRAEGDANFMFGAIGDSGTASANQYAVAALLQRMQPAFMLHTGDVIYPCADDPYMDPNYFVPYSRTLPSIPYFTSLGNHDVQCGPNAYLDSFYLPSNNPLNTERYYSFDYGNAHFIALDSNQSTAPGSDMYNWLANDLAGTTKFWKFVYFHHAIYTSGAQGLSSYVIPMRNNLAPLFEQYNVDIVFNGHDHDYERVLPRRDYVPNSRGVVYIVTGGGGASLGPKVLNNPWTAAFQSLYHAVRVSIAGCQLSLQAIQPNDVVFDSLTLDRCTRLYLPILLSNGAAGPLP